MLIKDQAGLEAGVKITIKRTLDGRDIAARGAVPTGSLFGISVEAPRALGIGAIVLRMCADGREDRDIPLNFTSRRGSVDLYTVELDTTSLRRESGTGLFFYELLFLRGIDTLFSDTWNNVAFELTASSGRRFRLLIYDRDFTTPSWFAGGTMYHIFVDRFRRGEGPSTLHENALLEKDWERGIPQYAKKAGDHLDNNLFFGGNLWGIIEKLDYLQSLGVTVLYLSPIFKAYSNHRYDTGDYETVDPLLGGDEALDALLEAAHEKGMRVILDGVFNHTGDDSKYFNRPGRYEGLGAYQSVASPYARWYTFRDFPDRYESWWGIDIMPRLNQNEPSCRHYFTGDGKNSHGIAGRWIERGIDGWRLDVADELNDAFLDEFRATVKKQSRGEALIIGEVWENAVTKIAYGYRRRYFGGKQLDSVMNYPFRNAVLAFVGNGDAGTFCDILEELYASYPPDVCNSLMNLLGTHDTLRILTLLGDPTEGAGRSNAELSLSRLDRVAREKAVKLLKIASTLQFTVYGVPSVYYGDEVGLEGYHDPFCRMPFPWGHEDEELLEHYRALGRLRRDPVFATGDFRILYRGRGALAFTRSLGGRTVTVAANITDRPVTIDSITVPPLSCVVV